METSYLYFLLLIFLLNLPFGYWRAGEKDRKNFKGIMLAIHIPVIIIIVARILLGLEFSLANILLSLLAFSAGQFLGGFLRKMNKFIAM